MNDGGNVPDKPDNEAIPPSTERRRVIAEEEFRKATAMRLAWEMGSGSRGQRLVQFFNTSLGIWVLSTLIVGAISAGWQHYTGILQQKAQQRPVIVSTANELLWRLAACDRVRPTSGRDAVETLLNSIIGLRPLNQEFKGRNLADVYYHFAHSLDAVRLLRIRLQRSRRTFGELRGL